jgi:signal transduction histidine kinase
MLAFKRINIMLVIIVKLLLLSFGILALDAGTTPVLAVSAVLITIILTALNQYLGIKKYTAVSSAVYVAVCFFEPVFVPFIPLFCFDLLAAKLQIGVVFAAIPVALLFGAHELPYAVFIFILIALASFFYYICEKIELLTEENRKIRDNSTELNRMLANKNKNLIEKQHYEIHLATLKERNRIAREIHDNVGHILSRSILQTGALQAINKNEQLNEHISGVKDTLSLAMDSIRNSVHGLRDESVDLYESIRRMTERSGYEININYDITQNLSNSLKYCFLSVIKEAFTNIERHSNASRVQISVQEHPALYQLLIHDNGAKKPLPNGSGMGLSNMEERVSAFNGHFSASYQNGFRIFISIPKQEDNP